MAVRIGISHIEALDDAKRSRQLVYVRLSEEQAATLERWPGWASADFQEEGLLAFSFTGTQAECRSSFRHFRATL